MRCTNSTCDFEYDHDFEIYDTIHMRSVISNTSTTYGFETQYEVRTRQRIRNTMPSTNARDREGQWGTGRYREGQ